MSHKNNQKPSLKTNFLLRLASLSRKSQKGFTLYTAVGLGLLAVAGTTLALAKANKEQTNMTSNQGAKQALAITNGGINKSLSEFVKDNNAYLLLADYDGTQWTFNSLESNIQRGQNQGNYQAPANACGQYNGTTVITDEFVPFVRQIAANETFTETGTLGSSNSSSQGRYKVEKYNLTYPTTGLNLNPGTINNLRGNLVIEGQNIMRAQNKGQYLTNFTVNVQTAPPPVRPATAAAIIGESINVQGMGIYTSTAICSDPGGPGCTNGTTIASTACGSDGVLSSNVRSEDVLLEDLLGGRNNGNQLLSPNNTGDTNIVIQSFTIPPVPRVALTDEPKIVSIDVGAGDIILSSGSLPAGCSDTLLEIPNPNGGGGRIKGIAQLHCFPSHFVRTTINGQQYSLLNIKATNFPTRNGQQGELTLQIDNARLTALGIDSTNMIVRVYIPQSRVNFQGNAATLLVDGSGRYIAGVNETERAQISSLRLIAADTNGTLPTPDPLWTMSGTTCIMGQAHGPTLSIELGQGNGCPINLNTVMASDYGNGNYTPFSGAASASSPNVYGTIWSRSITNSSSTNTGIFFENTSLSEDLYLEYGNAFPQISGRSSGTRVALNNAGLTGLTREKAQ